MDKAKAAARAARWRAKHPEAAKAISRRAAAKVRLEKPEKLREYRATYYSKNRKVLQAKERERKFGITHVEYAERFAKQGGVCAICQKPETQKRMGTVRSLAVDHEHKTGRIRGLLCSDCNTGIGKLKDDCGILHSAIRYLSEEGQ